MMLDKSDEPIFDEAHQMQLPEIDRAEFFEYLDYSFETTGKPAAEEALDHLLNLTRCHPKRTQQLAWATWRTARPSAGPVDVGVVQTAHEELLSGSAAGEFAATIDMLGDANGRSSTPRAGSLHNRPPADQRPPERQLVGVLEVGAHRQAAGQPRDRDLGVELAQPVGDVERGRLAGGRRVGGDHDLADLAVATRS